MKLERARCVVLIAVLHGCAPAPAPAQGGRDGYDAIRASIRSELAEGRLTGISVALVHHGQIVWEAGFGWADRAAGRQATSRTAFSLASVTKSFTTSAVMMLAAAGKLGLDQPANDYLGADKIVDASGPVRGATVRRLASHSSGLPVLFEMYPHGEGQVSVAALLHDYGRIVAPPGERYEYSNIGLAVLADIVARQSGQEFGAYLQNHLLAPLGMRDSFFDTDLARRPEMVVRYTDDGAPVPFYLTATPGSGEMYASAHDLARYAMFHLKDRVAGQRSPLSDAQLDELHRPITAVQLPMLAYAMGWRVLVRPGQPDVLYHGGGQLGVAAKLELVPSEDAACVVLSNRANSRAFVDALCDRLLQTVLPGWPGIPAIPDPIPQPLAPIGDYAGQWRGDLIAQGRRVPVRLIIEAGQRASLAIDRGPEVPITELGLVDGVITGSSRGDIGSPDTRRNHVDTLALQLVLRGGAIDGEIIATNATATLPHWVELRRPASD